MTDHFSALPLAVRAVGEARSRLPSIALAASVTALAIIGTATVQAKQTCSVAAAAQGYWSWRTIDGRKCWYEGKPMLSKSALEWPAETPAQPDKKQEAASAAPESHSNPMDAQAYAPDASRTFDALWRDRIEGSKR